MEAVKKIEVNAPGARAAFERWLAAGDKVGVFSNHDLGSQRPLHVFLRLDPEYVAKAPLGTRAPDSNTYGPGWRYLLDEVVSDLSRFEFVS